MCLVSQEIKLNSLVKYFGIESIRKIREHNYFIRSRDVSWFGYSLRIWKSDFVLRLFI
jgi:hypothetical protein